MNALLLVASFAAHLAVGYVPLGKSSVGEDAYYFRGPSAGLHLLRDTGNLSFVGLFGDYEVLKNTYTEDGAQEAMTNVDIGILGSIGSVKFPMELQGGIGGTRATIRQTAPTERLTVSPGFVLKLGLQVKNFGKDVPVFTRFELIFRSNSAGKDHTNGVPVRQFSQWTLPLSIGISF